MAIQFGSWKAWPPLVLCSQRSRAVQLLLKNSHGDPVVESIPLPDFPLCLFCVVRLNRNVLVMLLLLSGPYSLGTIMS